MEKVTLVGILNITPDSFSDGGAFLAPDDALAHAEQLFADGAGLIDVGAESTRPGALTIEPNEEWQRLEPVLSTLIGRYPGLISVDTRKPYIISRAAEYGDVIANDVTGFNNPLMIKIAAKHGVRCVVSHIPPTNYFDIQQIHEEKPVKSVEQVRDELLSATMRMQEGGIPKDKIIVDPGIGFGKNARLNWELLRFGEVMPEFPVMIGYSRKIFLGPDRMHLDINLDAGRIAIAAGARYLRVHDVAGHARLLR